MFRKQKQKRSFFEKLTGAVPVDEYDDEFEYDDEEAPREEPRHRSVPLQSEDADNEDSLLEEADGQLSVDVVNTDDAIIVKSMLAGVKPSHIDIDISRDMVTIRGTREESSEVSGDNYYHRELYWGSFSRNILMPEEIDVDAAEAIEKHGLLTLTLPKLDKGRKAKVHVKAK